jgi:hypothetical protein
MPDGIDHGYREEDHHREPHAYMVVEVPDGLLQLPDGGYREQQTPDDGVGEQYHAKYLPPGSVHKLGRLNADNSQGRAFVGAAAMIDLSPGHFGGPKVVASV